MTKVLGISGSLRKGSYNTALLRAAQELLPDGMELEIYEGIGDIPLFNADVEAKGFPEPVRRLHERIAASDAVLIATPEYNYSIPGVLKNALDWASRPTRKSAIFGKPAAMMGASTGKFGTVRAQLHLREVCVYNNMPTVTSAEVLVMEAAKKFDSQGRLTDKDSRDFLQKLLVGLDELVEKMGAKRGEVVGV